MRKEPHFLDAELGLHRSTFEYWVCHNLSPPAHIHSKRPPRQCNPLEQALCRPHLSINQRKGYFPEGFSSSDSGNVRQTRPKPGAWRPHLFP